jgi:hypothetical protein
VIPRLSSSLIFSSSIYEDILDGVGVGVNNVVPGGVGGEDGQNKKSLPCLSGLQDKDVACSADAD